MAQEQYIHEKNQRKSLQTLTCGRWTGHFIGMSFGVNATHVSYSQKNSALRRYDGDIGLKKLKEESSSKKYKPVTFTRRRCGRTDRHLKRKVYEENWQCQRHMVIVCFEKSSELNKTLTLRGIL